jgi:hypothetical protein
MQKGGAKPPAALVATAAAAAAAPAGSSSASSSADYPVEPYELFNRKVLDFVEDLEPLLRHLPEYKLLSASTQWMRALDARQNQRIFLEWVAAPFGEQIRARDEGFFLRADVDREHVNASGIGVVNMLRDVWRGLSDGDKDAIWCHLQVLLVLSDRCVAATAAPRH